MNEERIIWICPADNTYNSGKFCIRCGRARPEVQEEEQTAAQQNSAPEECGVKAETKKANDTAATEASEISAVKETEETDSRRKTDRLSDGIAAAAGEKLGELFGDIAARFSRLELVKDIKSDKKKKRIALASAAGVLLLLFVLFGLLIAPRLGICVLGHRWMAADCTHPMTCTVCGREKGETLPHELSPATCTAPATCVDCGEEFGDALGHDWQSATCTSPESCARCGEHNGESLGHIPGVTRIKTAPTVMEPGEEEVLCRICGEVMDTQPCVLTNYIEGSGFIFTTLDYSKLLLEAKETVLPEINMLKYKDKTDCDCFAFWLGTETAATEKVADCKLYDENMELIVLDEENYDIKPYAVRWSFTRAWDQETIKTLMPFILRTFSPSPVDGVTLVAENDMTVDGLRYIYENNGITCRLTVLTTEACSFETVGKLFN